MRKFKFQLEALKKYRDNRLLIAKKDLMEVEGRRHDVLERIRIAQSERLSVLGLEDRQMLPIAGELAKGQHQKIDQHQKQLLEIEKEIDRHRAWVAHLSKDLKAVERLEEKKRQAYDEDVKKYERRFQDAWVVERWGISQHPGDKGESSK
jgi:hypothetical protein